jgi:DNA-directed RNA polymerase specialized sigma24 family protein
MMNRPLSEYLTAFISSRWRWLESKASSQIPNAIRSRVDVSQIVNDSLFEWIKLHSENEYAEFSTIWDEASLNATMIDILQKRTVDAIRRETTWKRGGRNAIDGDDQLLQCMDRRSHDGMTGLECEETLRKFSFHLDSIQLSVLHLRREGNTESEIAETLGISTETVSAARKAIAIIAEEVLSPTKNQKPKK